MAPWAPTVRWSHYCPLGSSSKPKQSALSSPKLLTSPCGPRESGSANTLTRFRNQTRRLRLAGFRSGPSPDLSERPPHPHRDQLPHSFLSPRSHSAFEGCDLHREVCFHQPRGSGPRSARRAPWQTGQEVRRHPWSPRHIAMVTSQEQDAASTMERCSASLTQAPLLPPHTPPPLGGVDPELGSFLYHFAFVEHPTGGVLVRPQAGNHPHTLAGVRWRQRLRRPVQWPWVSLGT